MVIFQKPNKSALITAVALISSTFVEGTIQDILFYIGIFSGGMWSYQEVTTGINIFRKGIGIMGFILLIYLVIQRILPSL